MITVTWYTEFGPLFYCFCIYSKIKVKWSIIKLSFNMNMLQIFLLKSFTYNFLFVYTSNFVLPRYLSVVSYLMIRNSIF